MAEQTIFDRPERLPAAFDGTEVMEVAPTSAGISYKSPVGTAAARDVTTSTTDTTAGRLLKVGDGGLLRLDGVRTDYNQHIPAGFYQFTSNATPSPGAGQRAVLNIANDINQGFQIAARAINNEFAIRSVNDTTFADWVDLYHTGNAPSDSAWTTVTSLANGWTGTVRYIKRLGHVTVIVDGIDGSSATDATMLTLPSGYRPSEAMRNARVPDAEILVIGTSGNIQTNQTSLAGVAYTTFSYPVI